MDFPADISEYFFILAIVVGAALMGRFRSRPGTEAYYVGTGLGTGIIAISYGLYIGTVWPFVITIVLGIISHLHEKMQARKQIQRLRDLYR